MRGRYEGLLNVVRFNWPKYVLGVVVLVVMVVGALKMEGTFASVFIVVAVLAGIALLLPLLVSHWIYDRSALFELPGLLHLPADWTGTLLNLNAGFDESSDIISQRWPLCKLIVADFYDADRHTEPSIERARSRYPSFHGTRAVTAGLDDFASGSVDVVHAFLSLHEVRDVHERGQWFASIRRVLRAEGRCIITEHQRDLPNLIAFNFGFVHFHSPDTWMRTFHEAGFRVERSLKTTPFITTYILQPH
jgi:SAM-dependent methyltransferase